MKKLYFIMAVIFFTACSDDDYTYFGGNEEEVESVILLKRKTITTNTGSVLTSEYRYNDNVLLEVTHSNGIHEIYSYTSGLLTEIDYYNSGSGNLIRKDVNNYDTSGALREYIQNYYDNVNPENSSKIKTTYSYEANSITVTSFTYDENGSEQLQGSKVLSVNSGSNIFKSETENSVTNYSFSQNNNPFININNYFTTVLINQKGGLNNIEQTQVISGETTISTYSTFIYNEDNFPIKETFTDENGEVTTTQYFY